MKGMILGSMVGPCLRWSINGRTDPSASTVFANDEIWIKVSTVSRPRMDRPNSKTNKGFLKAVEGRDRMIVRLN